MNDFSSPTRTSCGVRVFGSCMQRVMPDMATIVVAVSRVDKDPKEVFGNTKRPAQSVHASLQKAGLSEFSASRVSLTQEFRPLNGESKFIGYQAKIGFSVILRELERLEEILTSIIVAGANELTSVTFQTSRMKEIRADTRRRAIHAAREKAELYSAAAGASAGRVLSIEDVNPETLACNNAGHVFRETAIDDPGEIKAIEPGAITIGAAVNVLYEII